MAPRENAVSHLVVGKGGDLRPVMYTDKGRGLADVRTVSGEFLLDLQRYWRQDGWRILVEVGQKYPELVFASMVKLSRVMKVEIGSPGDFAKLGKQGILEKLQEKGGPEARQLFEKFIRDVEKLQAQQEQKDG